MKKILFIIVLLALTKFISGQEQLSSPATDGNVTFQVTTVSDGGTYSPRHVFAIWIKDAQGNFVISRKVMANNRKQHLVKWVANSGNNVVDAITGSTINSHTSHTISWDCRNTLGQIVPDGTYQVWVEYTSRNSASNGIAGPFTSVSFTKGELPQNITIPDENYFKNMSLVFEPIGVFINSEVDPKHSINIHPNPFSNEITLEINLEADSFANIGLYDLNGIRIDEIFDGYTTQKTLEILWKASDQSIQLKTGTYYIRFNINGKITGKKIVYID